MSRKKILFKVNGQVVVEETRDLYLNEIDEMKWIVASECSCHYDDVDTETIETTIELSEIDVTTEGAFDWKDTTAQIICGVSCLLKPGSDEYLDALSKGILEDYLIFNK